MNNPGDRASADATASPVRRRPGLTRDQVLSAVMAIIDEGGVEELTMRRLAKALDRNPMAIYRHAMDKDALLDGVVELVVADFVVTTRPGQRRPGRLGACPAGHRARVPPGGAGPPERCAVPGDPVALGTVGAASPWDAATPGRAPGAVHERRLR